MANLKIAPAALKSVQPYLKIAEEHDRRDPAIAYWCRYYAVQYGLKNNDKTPESTGFLISIMDWLENVRKTKSDEETISNDVVAQAHVENYALKLFLWADGEDRAGKSGKNVVKAFYTAGFLYDVVNTFGEPSEEVLHHRKYAKWKSTYIHNCLKNGLTPTPGPVNMESQDDDGENFESQGMCAGQETRTPHPIGFNISGFGSPVTNGHLPQPPIPSSPGSFEQPSTTTEPSSAQNSLNEDGICDVAINSDLDLTMKDYHKAQKLCKTAESALRYEDVPTAIEYLTKALNLLTMGKEE